LTEDKDNEIIASSHLGKDPWIRRSVSCLSEDKDNEIIATWGKIKAFDVP
tara:strand:+ start:235 stop:384 length:150 start_codon:yes stop_codon:yes gene_type:complete